VAAVRPSIRPSAARSSANVIATSSDAAVVCMRGLRVTLRCIVAVTIIMCCQIESIATSRIRCNNLWAGESTASSASAKK